MQKLPKHKVHLLQKYKRAEKQPDVGKSVNSLHIPHSHIAPTCQYQQNSQSKPHTSLHICDGIMARWHEFLPSPWHSHLLSASAEPQPATRAKMLSLHQAKS